MKTWAILLSAFLFCGCRHSGSLPPELYVKRYNPDLYLLQERWWYKGRLFSGYIVQEQDRLLVSKLPMVEGQLNGKAFAYFDNGHKLMEQYYSNNQLDGPCTQWWRNGQQRYHFLYRKGQYEGRQQVFFENGQLREEANFQAGRPEGLQRSWNEQGQLVSNYTIRNNKLYGIIRAASCVPAAGH